jgi:uncharacterized membrane protein YGL010W
MKTVVKCKGFKPVLIDVWYLQCHHGVRSLQAAQWLKTQVDTWVYILIRAAKVGLINHIYKGLKSALLDDLCESLFCKAGFYEAL